MTYRVRERLRRYVAGFVREETALRDGSHKTKTLAVITVGDALPTAEGDVQVPRSVEPATTPADTIEA